MVSPCKCISPFPRMPKGSDKSWVDKLYDKCKKWEHFAKPRLSQTAFLVRHFADQVPARCFLLSCCTALFLYFLLDLLIPLSPLPSPCSRWNTSVKASSTRTETPWWRSRSPSSRPPRTTSCQTSSCRRVSRRPWPLYTIHYIWLSFQFFIPAVQLHA